MGYYTEITFLTVVQQNNYESESNKKKNLGLQICISNKERSLNLYLLTDTKIDSSKIYYRWNT